METKTIIQFSVAGVILVVAWFAVDSRLDRHQDKLETGLTRAVSEGVREGVTSGIRQGVREGVKSAVEGLKEAPEILLGAGSDVAKDVERVVDDPQAQQAVHDIGSVAGKTAGHALKVLETTGNSFFDAFFGEPEPAQEETPQDRMEEE